MTAPNGNSNRGFLTPGGPLTDNVSFFEWCENSRRLLHSGALELGICASEIEARLRRVSGGLMVAGMSSRYRARQVTRPVAQAGEALVVASRYIITASNRFEAVYMPELEAAGYKTSGGSTPFSFKAG